MLRIVSMAFVLLLGGLNSILAYEWRSEQSPSFRLDIRKDWEVAARERSNGAIIVFSNGHARIEVRSFRYNEEPSARTLMNQKAARMAAEFNIVELLSEKVSRYRTDLYLSEWALNRKGIPYAESSGFLKNRNEVLSIACIAPAADFSEYQTDCENALYSIQFLDLDRGPDVTQLRGFFLYNAPHAGLKESEILVPTRPVPEKSDSSAADGKITDDFLPPAKSK